MSPRKYSLISLIICLAGLLLLAAGCGSLRTARIRKDVTMNTYKNPDFHIKPGSVIAVVPLTRKGESLGGIASSANDAAAEMMSLKLWNEGFRIIDKIFIKEFLIREGLQFSSYSVKEAVRLGEDLGADYVILTSLTDLEEQTRSVDFLPFQIINTVDASVLVGMNCQLVDVASKQVVWRGAATTQDKNLQLSLRRISLQMIYSLYGAKRPADHVIPGLGLHF